MLTNATVAYSTTVVVLCSKKSGGVEVRKRRNDATLHAILWFIAGTV